MSMLLMWFGALWSGAAVAQDAPQMGVWTGQLMTVDLDTAKPAGAQIWLDLHERQLPTQFSAIVRPGLGWNTGKGVSFWAGYGWIPTWDGSDLRSEHRVWQQAIGQLGLGSLKGMGRVRLEQRSLQGESDLGHRVRLFMRVGMALDETYGLSLWDEVFIHLNDTAFSSTGLNQNRAFLGPYIKADQGWRTEFGYLNLQINGADGLAASHVLAMNLFIPFKPGAERG